MHMRATKQSSICGLFPCEPLRRLFSARDRHRRTGARRSFEVNPTTSMPPTMRTAPRFGRVLPTVDADADARTIIITDDRHAFYCARRNFGYLDELIP